MQPPAQPSPFPTPEQARQIVDKLLQLGDQLLEQWMKTPTSSFQEQALRSLLPAFVPSLQTELRKDPGATVAVLAFVHVALGELLQDSTTQLPGPALPFAGLEQRNGSRV